MGQGIWRRTVAFMLATAVALTLTGCEVGGIDLPIDLPFDLPFTLPTIHVPEDIPTPAALIESATNERSLEESLRMRQHEPTLVAPTIRQDGVLTVGIKTTQEMAPLYLFDETTREISGYDIDVAVVLADELGLKVAFVPVTSVDSACTDSVDIVLNCYPDDVEEATLVGSYNASASAFFYKGETKGETETKEDTKEEGKEAAEGEAKGGANKVVAISDLTGASCGVQASSASLATLQKSSLDLKTTPYDNLNAAFEALEAGEISYVLCDANAGAYLARSYQDIFFAGTLDAPVTHGIAVAASNTSLQQSVSQAMETLQGNGILTTVRNRWIGALPALTADQHIAGITFSDDEAPASSDGGDQPDDSTQTDTTPTDTGSTANAGDGSTAGSNAITDVG